MIRIASGRCILRHLIKFIVTLITCRVFFSSAQVFIAEAAPLKWLISSCLCCYYFRIIIIVIWFSINFFSIYLISLLLLLPYLFTIILFFITLVSSCFSACVWRVIIYIFCIFVLVSILYPTDYKVNEVLILLTYLFIYSGKTKSS